ncbi:hypothetical protein P154DRAFT_583126 [Amniculicola lignicola CBS 123094]|uniref:Uncharacterized protein n=1 Tax=Amniculicola lignicola CBS 123094 TaxID=1392246 RepID=A0A6A5W663_9PLEO|nr:hypothetical protein P154DRAFT_583126 [Amniculicola lignicola CBS 123094]
MGAGVGAVRGRAQPLLHESARGASRKQEIGAKPPRRSMSLTAHHRIAGRCGQARSRAPAAIYYPSTSMCSRTVCSANPTTPPFAAARPPTSTSPPPVAEHNFIASAPAADVLVARSHVALGQDGYNACTPHGGHLRLWPHHRRQPCSCNVTAPLIARLDSTTIDNLDSGCCFPAVSTVPDVCTWHIVSTRDSLPHPSTIRPGAADVQGCLVVSRTFSKRLSGGDFSQCFNDTIFEEEVVSVDTIKLLHRSYEPAQFLSLLLQGPKCTSPVEKFGSRSAAPAINYNDNDHHVDLYGLFPLNGADVLNCCLDTPNHESASSLAGRTLGGEDGDLRLWREKSFPDWDVCSAIDPPWWTEFILNDRGGNGGVDVGGIFDCAVTKDLATTDSHTVDRALLTSTEWESQFRSPPGVSHTTSSYGRISLSFPFMERITTISLEF